MRNTAMKVVALYAFVLLIFVIFGFFAYNVTRNTNRVPAASTDDLSEVVIWVPAADSMKHRLFIEKMRDQGARIEFYILGEGNAKKAWPVPAP